MEFKDYVNSLPNERENYCGFGNSLSSFKLHCVQMVARRLYARPSKKKGYCRLSAKIRKRTLPQCVMSVGTVSSTVIVLMGCIA